MTPLFDVLQKEGAIMKLFSSLISAVALLTLLLIVTCPAKADWEVDYYTISGSSTGDISGAWEGPDYIHWMSLGGWGDVYSVSLDGSESGTISARYVWTGEVEAPSAVSCSQTVGAGGYIDVASTLGGSGSASGSNSATNSLALSASGGEAGASFNGEPEVYKGWGASEAETVFDSTSTDSSSGVTSFTISMTYSVSLSAGIVNAGYYTWADALAVEGMGIVF